MLGASSIETKLTGTFNLKKAIISEKVNPVLAPEKEIKELVRK
jgi:hypothetical protein